MRSSAASDVYKRQALAQADEVWVTKIGQAFEGDTTFPTLSEDEWETTILSTLAPTEKRPFKVDFCLAKRR